METSASASTSAPAAPVAPPPPADAPAAADPAKRLPEDARLDAALANVRPPPTEAEGKVETKAETEEKPAEKVEEKPAELPPRAAEVQRRLKAAKEKEAEVAKREEQLATREKHLDGEVQRIKALIEGRRPAFNLGCAIEDSGGDTAKIVQALRQAGYKLDAKIVGSMIVEGDPDDQPLTRAELRKIQVEEEERRRKAADDAAAKERQEKEAQAKNVRAATERAFLDLATPERAPTVAKALARLGDQGRVIVLEKAWKAQGERIARGQPSTRQILLEDVEAQLRQEYPEWAPSPPPAPAASAAPTKPPSAVSNAAASRANPQAKAKTETERWAEFERNQRGARNLDGNRS